MSTAAMMMTTPATAIPATTTTTTTATNAKILYQKEIMKNEPYIILNLMVLKFKFYTKL